MVSTEIPLHYPRRIAKLYHTIKSTTKKLQKAAASIGFLQHAIASNVTPIFAKVRGNFRNETVRRKAEISIMKSEIFEHRKTVRKYSGYLSRHLDKFREVLGSSLSNLLHSNILRSLRLENTHQLKTKNEKIRTLIQRKTRKIPSAPTKTVPIINLSSFSGNLDGLKYGLKHCFVDKNKFVRRDIATEFENLANSVDNFIAQNEKELFHEFLRKNTDRFTRNIYHAKDTTYSSLQELRNNPDIVILAGDKDSSVVLMNRCDYEAKVNAMIEEGITQGKYEKTDDSTHNDLANFQNFLYRNFKDHPKYNDMRPKCNQPARFFASAKTHKFDNPDEITIDNLKLRPIIDQTNCHTYNTAKIISDYLRPLAVNEYVISDTLTFPDIIKNDVLPPDEEYVSYDVESLFTSIPVKDTIDYILHEIYVNKVLEPICSKTVFKHLLERLCTDCVFSANGELIRQIDGCPMGGAISVIMSGIFMAKLEKDQVKPLKPRLYKRYVDDTISSRKKNCNSDPLFEALNSYHNNIKLTVEVNPSRFLDTSFHVKDDATVITSVYRKPGKLPNFWNSQVPKRYKRNAINGDLHRAFKISSDFDTEVSIIRNRFLESGFPEKFVNSVISTFKNKDKEDTIIPPWLFDDRIKLCIRLPYSPGNEVDVKRFIRNLETFTQDRFSFIIIWSTRNIRSLFPLKDRNIHPSCVIYEGTCSCGAKYIGETERNAKIRWGEHEKKDGTSEPAKHLKGFPTHHFTWRILARASRHWKRRKILEAFFITINKPKLNDQVEHSSLFLFRNGIT